jgi:hypothetical protein
MSGLQFTLADQMELRAALNAVFDERTFPQFLMDHLQWKLATYTSPLLPFPQQLQEVIAVVNQEGQLTALVRAASAARPASNKLREMVGRINRLEAATARAHAADPFEVVWLASSKAMIDRKDLRERARDMLLNNYARVMVVAGLTGTGRSYSLYYFQHLAKSNGFQPVDFSLQAMARTQLELNAYQLARSLDQRLDLKFPFDVRTDEKPDTFKIEPFVQKFIGVLQRPNAGQYVLIFDGFGHIEPAESGLLLIHRLAEAAENSLSNLHLILLGFDAELSLGLCNEPLREATCDFTDEHVIEFFKRFYRDVLQRPNPDDMEVVTQVAEVLHVVRQGVTPNVTAIGRRTTEVCRRLIRS